MAKVKLGKNSPSHVSESYRSQLYSITQVNQDMKVLFVLRKKKAIPKNWLSQLELEFSEKEEKMNSLRNNLQ